MKSTKDSANLDVLRAVAVLCVLTAHLLHFSTGVHTKFQRHLGQLGVIMFFVHTSLVPMFSLERTRLNGHALFFSFCTRRAFGIYPLSILCVLAVYFARYGPDIPLLYSTWTHKELVANLTLTTNLFRARDFLSVLWTLPLGVQMYLFLPLLFVAFRSRSVRLVLLLWVASIPLALLQPHYAPRLNLFGFAPCFLAGVISWRLHAPNRDRIPFFTEIPFAGVRAIANTVAKYSYGIYLTHTTAMTVGFLLLRDREFLDNH